MVGDPREIIARVDSAERHSFEALYQDAPADLGAGMHVEGPVLLTWMTSCNDPGFSGPIDFWSADDLDDTLERLNTILRDHGASYMSLTTHPHQPADVDERWFEARQFVPEYSEQVMWRMLDCVEPPIRPDGVEIRRAETADAALFAEVLNTGFGELPDDGLGRAFAAKIEKEGWLHYFAMVDGEAGAAAAMFIDHQTSTASFFAASTLPAARRRGAQTALIQHRLRDCVERGVEVATCQAVTDSASPRNFRRQGFEPLYRRTIYARRL